ncbi:uncharacterized protein LOC127804058 isoform X1 [Diospyros lotus]|uniref:uncharacterized protein LOC127804058 isoform X1 n=1 Tax=Diospyros lotus TaxID=55363 RepID=UPI00224F6E1A|nr:uncharacterized protein LOC127804058 isoform X1 [Diospyros lotus]
MARTMAFCISIPTASSRSLLRLPYLNPQFCVNCFPSSSSTPSSISNGNNNILRLAPCRAAKQQQSQRGPVKKGNNKKKKKVGGGDDSYNTDDVEIEDDGFGADATQPKYQPLPLPNPPAGFVLDKQGRVLMVSNKRVATIVDSTNNLPLDCIIRRVFRSSRGDECMVLYPVDTPVQILKSKNIDGWSAVSDEEVESILPTAAYALAKIHMHLVHSGFCYTARGGFCYTEDDIFEFRTDDGQDVDGLPTEGIEITCFHLDGSHYMIYTPSDPLLFVAVKDQNGQLQIVDDDLLEDPAVIGAIDEETEFNALVEEEAALLDSLLGKR